MVHECDGDCMEALWDDLCRRDAVPVPQWHKEILDQRERLVKKGKVKFIDWETASERLGNREMRKI